MTDRLPCILQVNAYDQCGGAERIACLLLEHFRRRGCSSWLAVGHKRGNSPAVVEIPNTPCRTRWTQYWLQLQTDRDTTKERLIRTIADPWRTAESFMGREPLNYPGTRRLPSLIPQRPDILHLHNLHNKYFDLRELPALSRQLPVFLTLHDAWLLGGACTHSLTCERWKSGCGKCPYVAAHPEIRRDATAHNWRTKAAIYRRCRLHVTTPSHWLMRKVTESILQPAITDARVIPNGIDLNVYTPASQAAARHELGLAADATILLAAGVGLRNNEWKDYRTIEAAAAAAAEKNTRKRLLLLAVGEAGEPRRCGRLEIHSIPHQSAERMATYYRAADLYLHAAKADTFPNTVLEALACGTPVVATAVGGIPEQIRSLDTPAAGENATGILVPPADVEAMAQAIGRLLADDNLRQTLSRNAGDDAQKRFNIERQVDDYLNWYLQVLGWR